MQIELLKIIPNHSMKLTIELNRFCLIQDNQKILINNGDRLEHGEVK